MTCFKIKGSAPSSTTFLAKLLVCKKGLYNITPPKTERLAINGRNKGFIAY
jgi:2C-methyl-D-erythritol 2,4-cyclodiphosphate synthase